MNIERPRNWTALAVFLLALGWTASPALAQREIPLGSEMPMATQSLENAAGGQATLGSLRGSVGTVVIFWSNQCPWVDKYQTRISGIANTFQDRGVNFVLVNSNDPTAFPREAPAASREWIGAAGLPAAYLMDTTSELANAFGAERAPHVFVFDANSALVYVGAVDDSPGDPANVKESYLNAALEALVGGRSIAVPQTKAFGCTIKFKQ